MKIIFSNLCIILVLLLVIIPSDSVISADNAITFSPPVSLAQVGDTIDIHLALDTAVENVMMYIAHIRFDSNIVRLIDAFPDTAWSNLSQAGTQYFNLLHEIEVDEISGDTTWHYRLFDIIWSGIPKITINGYAEIATVRFEILDHGASFLYYDTNIVKDDLDNIVLNEAKGALIYVCPLPPEFTFAGDADASGSLNVADLVYLVDYLFKGGPEPLPIFLSGDSDCDLRLNVADLVYLVDYVFKGGPPPCNHCP